MGVYLQWEQDNHEFSPIVNGNVHTVSNVDMLSSFYFYGGIV